LELVRLGTVPGAIAPRATECADEKAAIHAAGGAEDRRLGRTCQGCGGGWGGGWVQVFAFVELYSYLLPLAFGRYWDEAVHFHLKLTISTFLSTLSIDLVSMGHVMRLARMVGFIN
ncbi:hypothetical protein TrRE_jg5800, partial [Triparma retinervis]